MIGIKLWKSYFRNFVENQGEDGGEEALPC